MELTVRDESGSVIKGDIAVYLVSHGPYSKPRLIDLQYARVMRFIQNVNLEEIFRIQYINILPPYSDVGVRNYLHDYSSMPSLIRLIKDFERRLFCAVLIDVDNSQSFQYTVGQSVTDALRAKNIPYINVFWEKELLRKSLNIPEFFPSPFCDNDDFFAFFPKYANSLLTHLKIQADQISRMLPHIHFPGPENDRLSYFQVFFDKTPYIAGNLPVMSAVSEMIMLTEKNLRDKQVADERRIKERLYLIELGKSPLLIDEGVFFKDARNENEMELALKKLESLGFSIEESVDRVLYIHKIIEYENMQYCAVADPRCKKSIRFTLYKLGDKPYYIGQTYLPDYWVNNLYQTLEKRLFKEIENKIL